MILPDAEVAAKSRERRHTMTFLTVLAVWLIIGAIAYVFWAGILPGSEPPPRTAVVCPTAPASKAPIGAVELRVFNASKKRGLASTEAKAFQARGFRVLEIGNADGGGKGKNAVLRHGPGGVRMARTVAAQLQKAVEFEDDGRDTTDVDLVIGEKYAGMLPVEDVEPEPSLPPGCQPVIPGPVDVSPSEEAEPTTSPT